MHILLTNDDGFTSEGLLAAYSCLRSAGHRVTVCAPDRERSAQSQSITVRTPLLVMEEKLPDGETGYAVSGTPADCARLGFMTLAKDLDLLVSGINLDCNLGYDVNYSGTVAAALEAAGAGFPAIAASLEKSSRSDWPGAGAILADVIQKMPGYELPKGIMLNLNIPHSPRNLEPVWTAACNEPALDYFSRNELSPGTSQYIRCRGYGLELGPDSVPEKLDNDVSLIRAGYITLSPLTKVSVHEETLRRLSGAS